MVKEITTYQSDSGARFDSKIDALKDDLAHALAMCSGTVRNEALANDVARYIAENIHTMMTTFNAMREEMPNTEAAPVPPQSSLTAPHFCNYRRVEGEQLRRCSVCENPEPMHAAPQAIPPAWNRSPSDQPEQI